MTTNGTDTITAISKSLLAAMGDGGTKPNALDIQFAEEFVSELKSRGYAIVQTGFIKRGVE